MGDSEQQQQAEAQIHSSVQSLESQADLLMRRVQRLQIRMCQRHMHKHMQSFVRREQTASGLSCQLQRKVQRDNSAHSNGRMQHKQQEPLSLSRFLDPDAGSLRNMSTSALADIVRGWDKQSSDSCRLPDSLRLSPSDPPLTKRSVDRVAAQQTLSAAGQLQANVRHLEEDYDSDATESSSGGESCDDGYGFCEPAASPSAAFHSGLTSKKQSPPNLKDSTTWTWAVQRAAIACRWMWLIAQVADLEFKIRQQNEMYCSLRQSKGRITLENRDCESADGGEPSHCMRTLSLQHMNKRKLVRCSSALSGAVRKVARYSTVPCSCSSLPNFASACVLCNGRFGYVQVIDTDCMPQCERIAILDPACHPVLTLPTQIPLGLHFSKYLKNETVQKSIARKVNKTTTSNSSNISKKAGSNSSPESPGKYLKDIRRSNHKKSNAVISSNKLRKKYESNSKRKYPHNNCEYSSSGKRSKASRERHESSSNGSNESGRPDSPIQSPLPTENSASRRRRSEYAYDINNIVIPYSIASTTRVEKLQYKEILTPKWREVGDVKAEAVPSDEEEIEDLSDTAFTERHLKCEMDEKKRFLTFLPPNPAPGSKRARTSAARVRCDSRGETTPALSGNNGFGNHHTEDCNSQDSEISNHTNDHQHHNHHQPQQHHNNINNSSSMCTSSVNHNCSKDETPGAKGQEAFVHGNPARAFERRRTTSSSRTRDDSVDDDQMPDVLPFEKRLFPLAPAELEDLVSDADEVEVDVNGKHGQENGTCPGTPGKTAFSNESDILSGVNAVNARPTKSSGALAYASSGGESDHDEEEDPEWKPKEQS